MQNINKKHARARIHADFHVDRVSHSECIVFFEGDFDVLELTVFLSCNNINLNYFAFRDITAP